MPKYFSMDGYVCGKIETRETGTGKLVTSFSVNSPDRRKRDDGQWQSVPQFFNCKLWHRGDHDFRASHIVDGAHLQISGEPHFEEWDGKYGKRTKVTFNVRDLLLIAPRDAAPKEPEQPDLYDEDIPF